MNLSFDLRGNLHPYEKITIDVDDFKQSFVTLFEEHSTRHQIFSNYLQYTQDFIQNISNEFIQWIDGSFTTNKFSPGDIDLVTLLDYKVIEKNKDILQEKFLNKESLKKYKIDAYIVRLFPEEHPEYSKTVTDLLYWEHWFGNTKKNRAKKRFPKGFIEIINN